MLLMHDENGGSPSTGSLFRRGLIATKCPDWMDNIDTTATTQSRLGDLEITIARWVARIGGEGLPCTKIRALAISVPDILIPRAAKVLSYRLAANHLFRHAKLLPSSLAIAYYFIKQRALSFENVKAQTQRPRVLMVLNCEEVLVECTPYSLRIVEAPNGTGVELAPLGSGKADLCG